MSVLYEPVKHFLLIHALNTFLVLVYKNAGFGVYWYQQVHDLVQLALLPNAMFGHAQSLYWGLLSMDTKLTQEI